MWWPVLGQQPPLQKDHWARAQAVAPNLGLAWSHENFWNSSSLQPQARPRASSGTFTQQVVECVCQVLPWALGTLQGTGQIKTL